MKNNIIKDDREISMKLESLPTDISSNAESIATVSDSGAVACEIASPLENDHSPTEIFEMTTDTRSDLPDPTASSESTTIVDESITDPAVALQSTQTELTALFENAKSTATDFFNNNRQLFITLGWIVLAILGGKVIFATLGIIDDIPLVTPIIKLVGLVSVVRFAWRYLIREHDRQELIEIIDRTKVEVLGDRQSLS